MQEKVTSGQGPAPIAPQPSVEKAKKTSDEAFQHISEYVRTSSQSSILRETLLHLEILSEQSGPAKKPLDFLPKDPAALQVYAKTEVASNLAPAFQNFLDKGDYDSLLEVLKPFVEGKQLPRGTDESVNTLLAPFLNARPDTSGPTLAAIALKQLAGNKPQTLNALANQDPPSPLAEAAQSLLDDPDVQTTLSAKDFSAIFTKNRSNLKAIPIKLQAALSVPSLYYSYKQEIKDQKLTTTTKQSLLPVINVQMNYLQKATSFLQETIGNTPDVQKLVALLATIKTPPGAADKNAVKTLSSTLFETYENYRTQGKITQEQHQKFLDLTADSLNQMSQETLTQRKAATDTVGQVQDQIDQIDEVDDQIDQVEDFLKNGGDPEQFASTLSDLSLTYRNQDPEVQKRIDDLFNEVANLKTTEGQNLSDVAAGAYFATLVDQYNAAKKDNPNMAPLQEWLKKQPLPKMNNDFVKGYSNEIKTLTTAAPPAAAQKKTVAFEDSAVQPSLMKANALQNSLDETSDQHQATIEGTKGAMKNLDSVKESVDNAQQVVDTKKAIAKEEAPNLDFSGYDIVKVLDKLNKMMDAEMRSVATDLSNANAVRTSLTNLMSFLVNFPNANATYGLGQWLTGQTNQPDGSNNMFYNCTASMVVARCQQEISQAKAALKNVNSLFSPVNQLISSLNKIKAQMGKKFPDSLQKTLDDMNNIKTSLSKLQYYIGSDQTQKNLSVLINAAKAYGAAHPGDSKVSLPKQNVQWLVSDENKVVNGYNSTVSPWNNFVGFINLHDMVQNDSQSLAMLSQSEQMDVQLNFTEMSQYWQAITQLISKLHDIFNSPIQGMKSS